MKQLIDDLKIKYEQDVKAAKDRYDAEKEQIDAEYYHRLHDIQNKCKHEKEIYTDEWEYHHRYSYKEYYCADCGKFLRKI